MNVSAKTGQLPGPLTKVLAIAKSCHPIPCLAVSLFAGMFAYSSGLPLDRALWIFLAVLLHQLSVGFSNDWLDFAVDKAARRTDKPTVSGLVDVALIKWLSLSSAALALVVTLGLGFWAFAVMVFLLLVGWAYNLGMKSNWTSVIPYILGFGCIPLYVGVAETDPFLVPPWTVLVAALLGISAHFANVLPDMLEDNLTGVNALPHILGQRISAFVIGCTALLATVIVINQSIKISFELAASGLAVVILLVTVASILSLKPNPPRIVFPLLMITALVNVVLLFLGSNKF
jgi:4-hydroxybenzoate polyprenyltransferase